MKTPRLVTALAALYVVGLSLPAIAQDEKDPDAPATRPKLADILKETNMAPIVVPKTSMTSDDLGAKKLAWLKSVFRPLIDKELDGALSDPKKAAIVDGVLEVCCLKTERTLRESLDSLRPLVAREANLPVLQFFAAELARWTSQNDEAAARYRVVMERAKDDGPDALLGAVAASQLLAPAQNKRVDGESERRLFILLQGALKPASCNEETAAMVINLLAHEFHEGFRKQRAEQLLITFRDSKMPEWARRTMVGIIEIDLGWKARGSGFAPGVTDQGWKGFEEHMGKARDELTAAWKLRPDVPVAASHMIGVAMAGFAAKGEDMRTWFDRAVAAQFDYEAAYSKMLWGLRPRWGGSIAEMLAFGVACARTERHETTIPAMLINALASVSQEAGGQWEPIFTQPEVGKLVVKVRREQIARIKQPSDREFYQARLAMEAWMTRDYATSAEMFEKFRQPDGTYRTHNEFLRFGTGIGVFWKRPLEESRAYASKFGPDLSKALAAIDKEDFATAKELAADIVKDQRSHEFGLLRSLPERVRFLGEFQKGEWCRFPNAPDLYATDGGKWDTDKDTAGTVKIARQTAKDIHRSYLIVPLGESYEVKGTLELPADAETVGFGFAVGGTRSGVGSRSMPWTETFLEVAGDRTKATAYVGPAARLFADDNQRPAPDLKPGESVTFRIRRSGQRLSWYVNEQLLRLIDLSDELPSEEAAFAMTARTGGSTGAIRFTALEARRIAEK